MRIRFCSTVLAVRFLLTSVLGLVLVAVVLPIRFTKGDDAADALVSLLELVAEADSATAKSCLAALADRMASGELPSERKHELAEKLKPLVLPILKKGADHPLYYDAALLAAVWRQAEAAAALREVVTRETAELELRRSAIESLAGVGDTGALLLAEKLFAAKNTPLPLIESALHALEGLTEAEVATVVLAHYESLPASMQPRAIELLTRRTAWSKSLLQAIGQEKIAPSVLNANQVRQLLAGGDEELRQLVTSRWGAVRTERNPQREAVIVKMEKLLRETKGDPHKGRLVFNKVCGQCHKIYGQGEEVGPDLTGNGRSSYAQLLSNVFDPSLVIGASYQARTLITADGRVLTGLVVEEGDDRVVLNTQGGKQLVVPQAEIEEMQVSKLSLMPEGLETQIPQQELADLFSFLSLDRPPEDKEAVKIDGAP